MTRKIKAVFDGETLRPEEPLELAPNARVRLTIETPSPAEAPMSFLRTARSLELDGPLTVGIWQGNARNLTPSLRKPSPKKACQRTSQNGPNTER